MEEALIAVDARATGPVPGLFSLIEIGACLVEHPDESFHSKLHPVDAFFDPTPAKARPGLHDAEPRVLSLDGMRIFRQWIHHAAGDRIPCFVGFRVAIAYAHVHYAFQMAFGESIFSPSALDLATMYFAVAGASNPRLPSVRDVAQACGVAVDLGRDNALTVAKAQAAIFRHLRSQARSASPEQCSS